MGGSTELGGTKAKARTQIRRGERKQTREGVSSLTETTNHDTTQRENNKKINKTSKNHKKKPMIKKMDFLFSNLKNIKKHYVYNSPNAYRLHAFRHPNFYLCAQPDYQLWLLTTRNRHHRGGEDKFLNYPSNNNPFSPWGQGREGPISEFYCGLYSRGTDQRWTNHPHPSLVGLGARVPTKQIFLFIKFCLSIVWNLEQTRLLKKNKKRVTNYDTVPH